MTNMQVFMAEFEPLNIPNRKNWFNTKTYWIYPLKQNNKNLKNLAKKILNTVQKHVKCDENINTKINDDVDRGVTISVIKKGETRKFGRPEEALERLIYVYNKNHNSNLRNQCQVSKKTAKKELVDLAEIVNGSIKSLIELKQWESTNSPIYAVVELIKYYYSCPSGARRGIKNLILLAPSEYYQRFKTSEQFYFWNFIDELNKLLPCSIYIKAINISLKEWEKETNILLSKIPDFEFIKKETSRYDEIAKDVNLSKKNQSTFRGIFKSTD